MPDVDRLRATIEQHFRDNAASYELHASALRVTYVLNRGGFVNHSFRVGDGRRQLHVKLATSADARQSLRRWHELDEVLRTYRAPPVLGWLDVSGASGLIFPVVAGTTPALTRAVLHAVCPLLQQLWNDAALTEALPARSGATAAHDYLDTYHDRFTEDLRFVRGARPAFVTQDTLDYLEEQAIQLAAHVQDAAAFQEPLRSPVHGDLWLDNILWRDATSWHLLDWDEVRIGDPAMDVAMLTGPSNDDVTPLKLADATVDLLPRAARARLPLLGQASLLDWAIDPLADWVDADAAPDHTAEVRREKEAVHRQALGLYQERYGG